MRLNLPPGANKADIQVFTYTPGTREEGGGSGGTWVKPADAIYVEVVCIGHGGAGGSGSVASSGSAAVAGGPGGGGSLSRASFNAWELPDQCLAWVPQQPVGAPGVASGFGLHGDPFGGNGTSSRLVDPVYFAETTVDGRIFVHASSGLHGKGGGRTQTASLLPTAENHLGGGQFTSGSADSASSGGGGGGPYNYYTKTSMSAGCGSPGGAGGGINSLDDPAQGGWGQMVGMIGPYGVGIPGNLNGTALISGGVDNSGNLNASPSLDQFFGVPGAGGSGGSSSTTANGGNGAAGAKWGGGGGGGAGARTGFTSGAGGNGGPGLVMVVTYF